MAEEREPEGFVDFSLEMEDFEYAQVKKFDRIFDIGEGGSFSQKPLIHEGVVYVGCMDHNVYALDAKSGELIWKFKARDGIVSSSPVISEGTLYIGSYDRNLYALDAGTGRLVWKFPTFGKILASVCVWEGKAYFGSNDHNVYCVDSRSGGLIWKYKTQGEVACMPVVYRGRLLIGSYDQLLYCLDAASGALIWKCETQGDVFSQPPMPVHDGVAYFPSFDNFLRAVDVDTGRVLWKFRTGSYGGMGSGPFLWKNVLYQSNREGVIYAITLDGRELWNFRINNAVAHPMVHDDRIYFGSEDYNLYCIGLDGKKLWAFPTQGELWWQPTISGGRIYFTSWDCLLYCVDVSTHKLVWKFRGQGSPSNMPPPFDSFELVVKKRVDESDAEEMEGVKRYDMAAEDKETSGFYKSRITYQSSTRYREKGKYQTVEDDF